MSSTPQIISDQEKIKIQQRIQSQLTKQQREKAKTNNFHLENNFSGPSTTTMNNNQQSNNFAPSFPNFFSGPLIMDDHYQQTPPNFSLPPQISPATSSGLQTRSSSTNESPYGPVVLNKGSKCEICNCICGSGRNFEEHCRGRRHRENLAKHPAPKKVLVDIGRLPMPKKDNLQPKKDDQVSKKVKVNLIPLPPAPPPSIPQRQPTPNQQPNDIEVVYESAPINWGNRNFKSLPAQSIPVSSQSPIESALIQSAPIDRGNRNFGNLPTQSNSAPSQPPIWNGPAQPIRQIGATSNQSPQTKSIPSLMSIYIPPQSKTIIEKSNDIVNDRVNVPSSDAGSSVPIPVPNFTDRQPKGQIPFLTNQSKPPVEPSVPNTGRRLSASSGVRSSPYVYVAPPKQQDDSRKESENKSMSTKDGKGATNLKVISTEGASSEFFCPLCRIRTQDAQTFRAHLACALHMQNAKEKGQKFKTFKCDICNVRGLQYSDEEFLSHLTCKSHLYMKAFILNDLIRQASDPSMDDSDGGKQKKYIFKFSERGGGLVECTLCNRVFPSALELLSHQQYDSHVKKLSALEEKCPVLYFCELCEESSLGKDASMKHMRSKSHLKAVSKSLCEDCPVYYRLENCKLGHDCPFRHCSASLTATTTCQDWIRGQCRRPACSLRHPNLTPRMDEKEKSSLVLPPPPFDANDSFTSNEEESTKSDRIEDNQKKTPFSFSASNMALLKQMVTSKLGKPVPATASSTTSSDSKKRSTEVTTKSIPKKEEKSIKCIDAWAAAAEVANDQTKAGELLTKLFELGMSAGEKEKSGIKNRLDTFLKKLIRGENKDDDDEEEKSKKAKMKEETTIDSNFVFSQFVDLCSTDKTNGNNEKDDESMDELLTDMLENERYRCTNPKTSREEKLKLTLMEKLLEKRRERKRSEKSMMQLLDALAKKNQNQPIDNGPSTSTSSMDNERDLAMDYFLRSTSGEGEEAETSALIGLLKEAMPPASQNDLQNDQQSIFDGGFSQESLMQQSSIGQFPPGNFDQGNLIAALISLVNGQQQPMANINELAGMLLSNLQMNPAFGQPLMQNFGNMGFGPMQPGPMMMPPPFMDFSVPPPPFSMPPPWIPLNDSVPQDDPATMQFLNSGPLTMSTGLNAVHSFSKSELEAQLRRYDHDDVNSVPFLFGGKDWMENAVETGAAADRIVVNRGYETKVQDIDICQKGEGGGESIYLRINEAESNDKTKNNRRDRGDRDDGRRDRRNMSPISRRDADRRTERSRRYYENRASSRRERSRSRSADKDRRRPREIGDLREKRRDRSVGDLREKLDDKLKTWPNKNGGAEQTPFVWNESRSSSGYTSRPSERMTITVSNERYGTSVAGDLYEEYPETLM